MMKVETIVSIMMSTGREAATAGDDVNVSVVAARSDCSAVCSRAE
jgi:hypothetical protein